MPQNSTDRNMLFGILALQMDFIRRDALIAAMNAWVLDKKKPIGQILLVQKALTPETHALLEALVQKHLELHGNDVERSLAAISSVGPVRRQLEQIDDAEVQGSLMRLTAAAPKDEGPGMTLSFAAGDLSSKGLRFRILRPHAKGGLGMVYVAHDTELNRDVALKEIQDRHADNKESRSRFLLEAEITGGLEHPSIVPVYGLGQYADGRPFYAMRFIRGDSLKDAIDKFHKSGGKISERPVEFRELLERLIDVCNAIQYAHDRGVLHRDLKPGNIMLGKYGETLVVDWGLAKPMGKAGEPGESSHQSDEPVLKPSSASGSADTMQGSAIGTPQYMSPEQAAGRIDQLGPASDIYSLGATLFCLLTGRTSVEDSAVVNQRQADLAAILKKVQTGDIPKPRQLNPDIHLALEAICLKAMALKPKDRYATPSAMVDDLKNWLADEPISAWPEPWTVKMRRWVGKHRTLVSGAAAAVLVGVVSLSVATVMLAQANDLIKEKNVELTGANTFIQKQNDAIKLEVQEKEKQRKLAESRLRQSLAAVGLFANDARRYCEDAVVPAESRQRLFEVLTTQLERQVDQEPGEASIDSLRNKVWMYQTLCAVNHDFGQFDESEIWFDKGMASTAEWEKARPGDPNALAFRATLLNIRANSLVIQKKLDAAKRFHTESLEIRRKLAGNPDVDTAAKVESLAALADSLDSVEQYDESLGLREKICKLYEKDEKKAKTEQEINQANERSFPYREAWCRTYQKAGLDANDYATRKKYLTKANEMSAELIRVRTTNRNLLLRWSMTAKMLGELEYGHGKLAERAGKMEEAEKFFAAAKVHYQDLNKISARLATSNELIDGLRDYARSFYTLGLNELRQGNPAKARGHFEMSRSIREQTLHDYAGVPGSAHLQIDLFFSQIALGELARTMERTDNMVWAFVREPDAEYRLACIYALAINTIEDTRKPDPLTVGDKRLQNRYRNEAIKCLRLAHDAGFTDFFQTNIDADFDALRDDPAIKEFEATHYYRLGVAEKKRGDLKKARAHFEKSQALAQEWLKSIPPAVDLRHRQIKIDWLCAHVQLGHYAKAIEEAEAIRATINKDAAALFKLARLYSLASAATDDPKVQEQYRTVALESLAQAGKLVIHINGNVVTEARLVSDDDLDPIRNDPRFKKELDLAKKRPR
jgi:serine/threonine protein kinase